MILSNTNLSNIQDQVRENALESFEFFANSVLSCNVTEELSSFIQDAVEDIEDVFIRTTHPRAVAIALTGWLNSRGVEVLSAIQLPKQEILEWLGFEETPRTSAALVEIHPSGVQLRWL